MSATASSLRALETLHPSAVRDRGAIGEILSQLLRGQIPLRRGVNGQILPEIAYLEAIEGTLLTFRVQDLQAERGENLLLNFRVDVQPYSMAVVVLDADGAYFRSSSPSVVYRSERRDRRRVPVDGASRENGLVRLVDRGSTVGYGHLSDYSPEGFAIEVPSNFPLGGGDCVELHFLRGERRNSSAVVEVRNERQAARPGWKQIGVSTLRGQQGLIPVERLERLDASRWSSIHATWSMMGAAIRATSNRAVSSLVQTRSRSNDVQTIDYENTRGQRIRAIVDSWGPTKGAPAIVIPPAWGRTKETLLPLAATLVSSFRAARRPLVVVRFDGIRRRGESFNDIGCSAPGTEYRRFTFSQAVDDILATLRFLSTSPDFQPESAVLISFSAASVDARRAVVLGAGKSLSGWISVVGSADLQSMMRVVSGGVDFVGGVERGIRFGLNRILGVEVDIDLAGRDALEARLAFLEDSCRDFEAIQVPITWFHGKFDAWMDLERIRVALSSGNRAHRRLVEIPTGHQLRSSREALSVFQLIAAEASRLICGESLKPRLPDLHALERRRQSERSRLPRKVPTDRRAFWRSYLLGPDGSLGIELLTGTSAFQDFMREQINLLSLSSGDRVVDLGTGTGSFPLQAGVEKQDLRLRIAAVDYVTESVKRASSRLEALGSPSHTTTFAICDLEVGASGAVPFRDGSFDAAIASLLLGYLDSPLDFFREVARVVRPGGRIVASGLKKDADVSRIFSTGVAELARGEGRPYFRPSEVPDLATASRSFLNEAARLFDLEEEGIFEFLEPEEVMASLEEAGFERIQVSASFGEPPQAMILSATRGGG